MAEQSKMDHEDTDEHAKHRTHYALQKASQANPNDKLKDQLSIRCEKDQRTSEQAFLSDQTESHSSMERP
jgi:hypothetical protein